MVKVVLNIHNRPLLEIEVDVDNDNIFDFKEKVEAATAIPVREMKVFFNGEELDPIAFKYLVPRKLEDFGIKEGSIVEIRGGVKIFCKMPNGRIHQTIVTLFSTETIASLKKEIKAKEPEKAPAVEDMELSQDDEILDERKTLADYGIGTQWWFTCVTVYSRKD